MLGQGHEAAWRKAGFPIAAAAASKEQAELP